MAEVLELAEQEFKTVMFDMLRTVMDKPGNKHASTNRQCKQRDGYPKTEPNRKLEVRDTVRGMKNAFDGLITDRLDAAAERIFEVEDISVESWKTQENKDR